MAPTDQGGGVESRVVELRVHGVSGTRPELILGDPYPSQVSGDDAARVFRRTTPLLEEFKGRRRIVEAFHWGRFTAGSPTRAVWLLLVPFAMLNLARFTMLLPHVRSVPTDGQRRRPGNDAPAPRLRTRDRAATLVLRLLGLSLTLLLVVTAAYIGWVIGAPQLSWYPGPGSAGYRILLGALVPGAAVATVWWLGRQTFTHDPPGGPAEWRTPYGSFDDREFWAGSPGSSRQRAAHVVTALGTLGLMALGLVHDPGTWSKHWVAAVFWALVVVNAAMVGYGVGLVVEDKRPKAGALRSNPVDTIELSTWLVRIRRWAALPGAVLAIGFAAWAADHGGHPPADPAPPEMAVNALSLCAAVLLLALAGTCAWQATGDVAAKLLQGQPGNDSFPHVPAAFRPFWSGYGAWMIAAVATALAFGLSTIAVFWANAAAGGGDLPLMFRLSAAIWGVLALGLVLLSVPLAAFVLARAWAAVWWVGGVLLAIVVYLTDADRRLLGVWDLRYLLAPAALVGAVVVLARRPTRDPFDDLLKRDYPGTGPGPAAAAGGGSSTPDDLGRGRGKVRVRWFVAESRTRYHWVIGALAAFSGLAMIATGYSSALQLRRWIQPGAALWTWLPASDFAKGPFYSLGVAVVSLIAAWLVALGLTTWRDPAKRATVGIIWDLLSFWPRDTHPLCPPPYGGRAVLGVATRAVQLAESTADGGLGARAVVLSGHSQGSLISVAAVAVLEFLGFPPTGSAPPPPSAPEGAVATDPVRPNSSAPLPWLDPARAQRVVPRLALVTYGSQLQFLYARLFPTYFGFGRVAYLYRHALRHQAGEENLPEGADPTPAGELSRWRNVFRWTDPLGAPVLSWPYGPDARRPGPQRRSWTSLAGPSHPPVPDRGHPRSPAHTPKRHHVTVHGISHVWYSVGPDIRLIDPAVIAESEYEPRLPPRGHSDYPLDPVFDTVVADLADHVRPPS